MNNRPTIITDEPHFSIIKTALNGFASGVYNSQSDVMRYLQAEPAFWKESKATKVYAQRVDSLLRNPFYSGQIVYEPWDVSLRKARHKAAIDYEAHQKFVAKLDGGKKTFCSNRDRDFPARGYIVCAECGNHITAAWSKGRKKKYPYYHCYGSNCPIRKKSISRGDVHRDIHALLTNLEVEEAAFATFEAFVSEAMEIRNVSAKEREEYYRGEVAKLKREQQQLIDKIAASDDEMLFAALQDRFRDRQKELKVLEAKQAKCAANLAVPRKLFEHARAYLASPSKVWENGDLKTRQTVLKVCFAEPLRYRRNQGF